MKHNKVIVIGGGASGLVAAIAAARQGAHVIVLEKMNKIGKKILATGNGRCNMTNQHCHVLDHYKGNQDFVEKVFDQFSVNDTLLFFEELGILHKTESAGRVYPFSDQAAAILDVFRMEIQRLNIEVMCDNPVKKIEKRGDSYTIYRKESKNIHADKVILACGGKAGPQFGSSGDGYTLAKSFGHTIIKPKPALVQLITEEWFNKKLKGVRAKGKVSLECGGIILSQANGEIQFTEDGFSGICVFDISRDANVCLEKGQKCNIVLDLFPDHTFEDIKMMLQMRVAYSYEKTIEAFLVGMINNKLIPVVLKLSGISDSSKHCASLSEKQLKQMASLFKTWKVSVKRTRSWEHAQVTAGGVSIKEINPFTLESIKASGLYFSGEIMDVDGICGGYNLQWAWATGYTAGKHAAQK